MLAGATLTKIEVDGVAMAAERIGHGVPVVCLNAVGHDARDFDPLVQRCPEGFEFIRIEWPNHGRSGPDHQDADPDRYARLVESVLAALGVERPILIGNSIGGAVAIRHAAAHPVRGLVLCDSGGLVEVNAAARRFCGLVERFFAAGERGVAWFPAAYALYYRLVLPTPAAAAHRREIVSNGPRLAPQLRQAWASFARPGADVRDLAAGLDAPIWVAWARSDRVIPLSYCRPAIERLRQARLTVFPGGHSPFLEQPDAFAQRFRDFAGALPG